jgi:hypothetical protein
LVIRGRRELSGAFTVNDFIRKWRAADLKERSGAQEHFLDLCRLLGEPSPADADPAGDFYCFERGATKASDGEGWADVWKREHFGWEYKGKGKNLETAFGQLQQYALALENPPLLVVCDLDRFVIRTNWTNTVSEKYDFTLEDLREPRTLRLLKWVMSDPEKLRPGKTRQELTEQAAAEFAMLAQNLRNRGHDAGKVAHSSTGWFPACSPRMSICCRPKCSCACCRPPNGHRLNRKYSPRPCSPPCGPAA